MREKCFLKHKISFCLPKFQLQIHLLGNRIDVRCAVRCCCCWLLHYRSVHITVTDENDNKHVCWCHISLQCLVNPEVVVISTSWWICLQRHRAVRIETLSWYSFHHLCLWWLLFICHLQTMSCCIAPGMEMLSSSTLTRRRRLSSCRASCLWVSSCSGINTSKAAGTPSTAAVLGVLRLPVCFWSHPGQIQSCQVPSVSGSAACAVCLWSETGERRFRALPRCCVIFKLSLFNCDVVSLCRSTNTPTRPSTLFTALWHSKSHLCCVFLSLSVCLPCSSLWSVTGQYNVPGLTSWYSSLTSAPFTCFCSPLCGNAFKFSLVCALYLACF